MPTSTEKPASLPSTATTLSPAQASNLTTALCSTAAIPRIQATLAHTLHEEGWSATLRAYVLQLLRSGECSTYDEVMDRVMEETMQGLAERKGGKEKENGKEGKENGVNGGDVRKVGEEGLRIPERVVKEGLRAVRKEIDAVCEVTYD
ncbi:hypothetical protein K490DRAFT_65246 [Saccharata proteae CBS 121410]|uniref:Uncharacterized protein n=1 Tax=Saccharata proteae CBS 121410 TaxID=1314787 RepID=A0A9P4HYL5_9PEZI|nr:hypothetical protein K490DRAFT_65246 [Saccharata proteae CBS 121410]